MAEGLGEELLVDGDDLLSDDSSFYGDADAKQYFECKASTFDPSSYWSTHDNQPSVIAFKNIISSPAPSAPKPVYNMYEECKSGRHLSETVPEFLARLPPFTTQLSDYGPWIFIANPNYRDNPTSEDLRGYKHEGTELLREFSNMKASIEASMPGKANSVIGRQITPLRKKLEQDIYALACRKGITSGKWMLFPSPEDVNRVWSIVAHATAEGQLGHAAKVATDDGTGNRGARLICVYNEDFSAKGDVKRVVENMVCLGLVRRDERPIYYKADALTWLEVNSGNEWGLRPSMYSSKEILEEGRNG